MLRLLHQYRLGFVPGLMTVAPDANRVAVLRRDADATGVLLRVDRDHGFTASKLHADLKFHSAFTTSARNLLLTRRDGDDVVVVELGPADRLREVRYEGYAKEADSECSGGPTEDRLAFTTNEGTVLCRFPGKQRVVESSQYLCDWRTHPSRELVAFTMFEGETQQLGFCLVSDGKLSWLTPLLETSCMIHSYAFAWDGRVVGLILHDGERVDTALYEFPSFAHLYRTTRNWDNRVDVKKRSLEGGIAFHPRRERFFTCEPAGKIVEREYPSGRETAVVNAHDAETLQIETLPAIDALVSIGNDGFIKLWSFADGDSAIAPPLVCDPKLIQTFVESMRAVDEAALKEFKDHHSIAAITNLRRRR